MGCGRAELEPATNTHPTHTRAQAELMHAALKARGVPTALVMFEGEQHGFRQAPNIRRGWRGVVECHQAGWGARGTPHP